jgi:hypothetical protein
MFTEVRHICFATLLLALFSAFCSSAPAQTRISDSDLERLMQNLRDDAKSFRPMFESSLKRSTIRKTSQEKDARELAKRFEQQTDAALKQFKKTKQNNVGISTVAATAQEIDKLVYGLKLNGPTADEWGKIQQELQQVESGFGIQPTPTAANTFSQSSTSGQSCRTAVGKERADRLVEECAHVSTATHSPCNAENSCVLIIDEIKRGCALIGRDAPQYCLEYK